MKRQSVSQSVSSERICVFNKRQNENCETKAVFKLDEVGGTAEGKYIHTPQVRTRYFYNSSHQAKKVTGLLARGNNKRILSQGQPGCLIESKIPEVEARGNSRGRVNPGGGASHKSPEGSMYEQHIQEKVLDIPNNSDNDTHARGTKVEGRRKQVAPTSVKNVIKTRECDKAGKAIVSGVKSTLIEQGDCVPLFDVRVSCGGDKFLNSILMNNKKSALCTKSVFINAWKKQTDFDFGFLPISDFIMPHVVAEKSYKCLTPLEMHAMVKASGQQNYLHCRIPVPSQLNIAAWKEMLQDYWDTQLIHLLEFGFPLDFNRNSQLSSDFTNHKSAVEFPNHVDAYLQEELKFGAILGPFKQHPIDDAHFSPPYDKGEKWF